MPSRVFNDIDELSDHLAGWDMELTQLESGAVVGAHGATRIGPVLVQGGLTLVPLIQRGAAPPLLTISVLASPDIRVTSMGQNLGGDHVFVHRPGEEIHWRTGPCFEVRTISVNEDLLRREAVELGLEEEVDVALRCFSLRPSPSLLHRLRQALFSVTLSGPGAEAVPNEDAVGQARERRLVRLLARVLASHGGSAASAALRSLDHVMARVMATLTQFPDRAMSRGELSAAVGVSDRTIRRASQEWCGTSPLSLAKIRRLHEARRELRRSVSGNHRVIDVAVRWGFSHMSRFAEEYGALFGERPSDTLRSKRSKPLPSSRPSRPVRH